MVKGETMDNYYSNEWKGRFNACTKVYPIGRVNQTVFNKPVFNPNKLDTEVKVRTDYEKKDFITRNDSLKRGKDKIFDIAILNDFDYFVTFTLDSAKISRYDYKEISSKLKQWLNNATKRNECKYLIVPELHQDGAVHFHGLIKGNFNLIDSGRKYKGKPIYNLQNWKYGFTTCVELDENKLAVARYICKYITKDTKMILGNLYYAGGGVIREPKKEYSNIPYNLADGKEYEIGTTALKVKYLDLYKGE